MNVVCCVLPTYEDGVVLVSRILCCASFNEEYKIKSIEVQRSIMISK